MAGPEISIGSRSCNGIDMKSIEKKAIPVSSVFRCIFLFALILPLAGLIQCDKKSNEIRTGNVRIVEGGESFPLEIPPEFKYPGAQLVFASTFEGSSFWTRPETTASLRTEDSLNAVANYYRQSIETSGWTIIQSRKNPDAVLYMAESGYKNLLTIIIRPEVSGESPRPEHEEALTSEQTDQAMAEVAGPTRVKLYLKQSGAD
ncbi:MAG TPA: hypothetical protein DEA96_16435 [Leptospiraceae bacterium]|nr:hypothetical protein [Spirochaetaceae bacterium]HBS06558.1 hypothetical protein [Leptospiraceae bacterium]